ncbi:MAG TPA: glycoside hydrolase family 2 protein [Terriglobia bacterium]|nr:glycoside hydrolase family 2 protein [Terriglobia bacterium]
MLELTAYGPARAAGRLSFEAIDAEPLGRVPPDAIVLHDDWFMHEEAVAGNDGAEFSTANFGAEGWFGTTVPTTVLGALVRLGVYPDPYIGNNNDRIPDTSAPDSPWRRPWWFRRTFEIPAGYTGKAIWLHLDGINYRAAVWVNGKLVASERDLAGMFRRFHFDISSLVHPGMDNALAIRIFPVDYPGVPGYREPGTDPGFQRNVTEMGALGWDWVPPARDRNMGIWQHVWIESSGPVAVWDPAAFADVQLPTGKQAAITLRFHVENTRPQPTETEVTARIEPRGFTGPAIEVRRRIDLPASTQQEVVFTPSEFPALNMRNPRLWWPHGYGDQPLYQLTVEVRTTGVVSHRQVTQFGVRKLGYFYRPAEYAHTLIPIPDGQWPYDYPPLKVARIFTVNGRPIRMAGGSMVSDFLLSWNAQRYRDEVRMMTEGNHTVIRLWGGGVIMPDVFYDEADRRGLLVWQDLGRSSFGVAWRKKQSEIPAVDKDLYLANMRDTILRLRGRTSLLAWCGTNEAPMQADIGMALQNEILPALDGTRPWLPSTSTEPPWAKEPLGMRSFGPYVIQDLKYYFEQYAHAADFLFKDEIGLESLPRYNSIAKAIPELDAPTTTESWVTQVLLDHGFPAQHMTPVITEHIGAPATLADFASTAELLSAQAHRAIFEAANKNRPRNSGTMLWMTNAAWLDCMYQLYDWYLHPTASYYAVKSAVKPLHVQYALDDHTLQVVSTLAERRPVQIHAVVMSAAGRTEEVRDYALTAAADATTLVGLAPAALADANLHFLGLDLRDPDGREVDRLVTWTQNDEKWEALLNLAPVPVTARVTERTRVDGESQYRIIVRNQGSAPAVHVWVEVIKGAQGDEVLPSFWSDNALTMLPGEERELTVRFRDEQLGDATPRLMVEGFNVLPNEFGVLPDDSHAQLSLQVDELWYEKGSRELQIKCSQTGAAGQRWTTWPLRIMIDGQSVRSLHVALSGSGKTTAYVPIHGEAGVHRVQVGAKSLQIRVD